MFLLHNYNAIIFAGYGFVRQLSAVLTIIIILCGNGHDAISQTRKSIHGTVTDAETGAPLPVAHIREAGTRNGTISNDSGEYSLTLNTLPATVIVSYIGYESRKITITDDPATVYDIRLAPAPVILETIVVYPEDEATRIMKKVIERKKEWFPEIHTMTTEAYTRISMSNEKRIVFMGESISTVYNDTKRGVREVIRYKRQTKNIKETENFANARMTPYLYYDDIEIFGFDCIGPTHPDAIDHYDFRIVETRRLDDKKVFVISIKPKSSLQTAFVGTISILDEDYAMIAADLKPSEAVMFPPPLKDFTFAVKQQFSNFDEDFWLPVDVQVDAEIKIKLPGLEFPTIKYRQLSRFSDYKINMAVPDSLFREGKDVITIAVSNDSVSVSSKRIPEKETEEHKENSDTHIAESSPPPTREESFDITAEADEPEKDTIEHDNIEPAESVDQSSDHTAQSAYEPASEETAIADESPPDSTAIKERAKAVTDSVFTNNPNIVPFTEEEEEAYATIDSTLTADKAFRPTGVLSRLIKDEHEKKKEKKEPGPVGKLLRKLPDVEPHFHHNRVDEYHLGVTYDRHFLKRYTVTADGGYKTGPERWSYGGSLSYSSKKILKGAVTTLKASTATASLYETNVYPLWLSGIQTLSGTRDYYDYYRNDSAGMDMEYRFRKIGVQSTLGIAFEHHSPLVKTTNAGIAGTSYTQRSNPTIETGQLRSVKLRLLKGQPYHPVTMAERKGLELTVEHSSPALFESDYTFTRWNLDAEWRMETFFRRRLFPCTLDMRFTGGTSAGKLPLQRFGSLDGSLGVLTPFGTFRSLRNRPLVGEHWCGLFMEHNFRTVPFEILRLRWLAERNVTVILHGAAGRTWISKSRLAGMPFVSYRDDITSEIGFSINTIYSLFRLDVTKRLDRSGGTVGVWLARYL